MIPTPMGLGNMTPSTMPIFPMPTAFNQSQNKPQENEEIAIQAKPLEEEKIEKTI